MSTLSTRLYHLTEGVRIALDAIIGNKVRAGLTILGVAVGVFVVVVISAIVHGINVGVARDLESTGPSTFYVVRYPVTFEACDGSEDTCTWLRNPPISWTEVERLSDIPNAAAVGVRMDWTGSFRYRDKVLPSAPIEAYTANWASFGVPEMQPGSRAFTEQEVRSAARVLVLNTTAAERLFGESDPLGKNVAVNGVQFVVIGVFKENTGFLAGDRAKGVMPVTTLQRALNVRRSDMGVIVKPRAGVARDELVDEVIATMRATRGLRPSDASTFEILTQDQIFDIYNRIFGTLFLVMIALSAVGLMVGGVGVVAIMMISVTERTREIGVRKALGATRLTILLQFLIEAVTLTGIGAIIGLGGGWIVTLLLNAFVSSLGASIPLWAALVALLASAITGVAFGMIPAARASRLDPVEALRYE